MFLVSKQWWSGFSRCNVANDSVLTLWLILSLNSPGAGGWFAACQIAWGWKQRGSFSCAGSGNWGTANDLVLFGFFLSFLSFSPLLFLLHALCLCRPLVKKSVLATQPAMALQVTSIYLTWCSKATRLRAHRPRPWGESPRMHRTWTRCLK